MRVISRKRLKEAVQIHAELATPLDAWYRIAKGATWRGFTDVRTTWASADIYKNCTIFDIKGNKFRIITWVNYQTQKVFIKHILTHANYTKGGWQNECESPKGPRIR
ncbi:MAG TPA: type II toxin-antitoxin system HigB family toxin [Candidatus Angelobacter sp.]|nr:type II toxin-antitoxin system HigB family toxin [Candidatus Angelobacter sp.]